MHVRILKDVYLVGGQDCHLVYLDWDVRDSNVYLVDTGDTLVLVDCGCGETLPAILTNIKQADFDLKDLSHLILTHEHFEHAGAADPIARMGIEVIATQAAADALDAADPVRTGAFLHCKKPVRARVGHVAADDEIVSVGRYDFRFMAVPGHSAGSLAVKMTVDGRVVLFTGDTVTPPEATPPLPGADADPDAEFRSLRRLLDEEPDVILPGRGFPCFQHGRAWIEKRIQDVVYGRRPARRMPAV